MIDFFDAMEQDCTVLLERALKGKTVNAFGIDGFGQYATCQYAKHFTIGEVQFRINRDCSPSGSFPITGEAIIQLIGYDSLVTGHVATDQNLKISLNALFAEHHIDKSMWTWGPVSQNGEDFQDFFVINIDVNKLIGW